MCWSQGADVLCGTRPGASWSQVGHGSRDQVAVGTEPRPSRGRVLSVLDEWLVGLFAPDRVEDLAAEILETDQADSAHAVAVAQAQRTLAEAHRKIDRHLAGLEAGIDPELIAERNRKVAPSAG